MLSLKRFLPEIWIFKLVREMGSGVPPEEAKGERREFTGVDTYSAVAVATPFPAAGRKLMMTILFRLGRPFDTRKLKPAVPMLLNWYWNKSSYTIFFVGDMDR